MVADMEPTDDGDPNSLGGVKLRDDGRGRIRFIGEVEMPIANTLGLTGANELTLQLRRSGTTYYSCTLRSCPTPAEPPPPGFIVFEVFRQRRNGVTEPDECGSCPADFPIIKAGDVARVRFDGDTILSGQFE
jgi:hypothetical protein